jgi:hypothetical protein
VPFVAADFTAV